MDNELLDAIYEYVSARDGEPAVAEEYNAVALKALTKLIDERIAHAAAS